jgi:hypothetical protein
MVDSGAWGKLIYEKSPKSCDTVPLKGECHEIFASGFFMNQFAPSPGVFQ